MSFDQVSKTVVKHPFSTFDTELTDSFHMSFVFADTGVHVHIGIVRDAADYKRSKLDHNASISSCNAETKTMVFIDFR